jgi:hypothetical protein
MVLRFDPRGFEFQSGIDALQRSAEAGLSALSAEIKQLNQELRDYRQSGKFEGERDDDGVVIWDREDILDHEIDLVREAQMELRKAFAIAAFHQWERSVQRWIGQANGMTKPPHSYDKLSKAAAKLGYPVDAGLQQIVTLVNTLKHNVERRGRELLEQWPDVFPPGFEGPDHFSDWASSIQLSDELLEQVFVTMRKSGPGRVHS